jgi:2-oxoisovalerate dehydrogenase E2 component (dihydrolipoyl transacylase)
MLKEFVLPDLGEGIVECELVEWLVKEGDSVVEDQPIADVMTDKALVQIPAAHPGIVSKLYYQVGEMAKVGAPLFSILTEEQGEPETQHKFTVKESAAPAVVQQVTSKAIASPAVRRLAREMGIDLNSVTGTGEKGRVYKEDLVAHARKQRGDEAKQEVQSHLEPLRGVQAAMAKQMTLSMQIPHFSMSEQVDFTELTALKRQLSAELNLPTLTMMPFLLKALSVALSQYPILNSQLHEQQREIEYYHHHHIGVAVDTEQGLLVPVVRHVEQATILSLAEQLASLFESARAGTLSRQQLSEGTFTVSNVGTIGGTTATPIINYPQSAILAIGRIQQKPRFNSEGQVLARAIADISWSADHRIIDGATLARFSNRFVELIQQPSHLLVNLR